MSNCGVATVTSVQDAYINHGFYFYIHSMLKEGIDTPEILSLIAPRPFLISATLNDDNFTVQGVKDLYNYGMAHYKGCPQNLRLNLIPGEHVFSIEARETAYKFLDKHLRK